MGLPPPGPAIYWLGAELTARGHSMQPLGSWEDTRLSSLPPTSPSLSGLAMLPPKMLSLFISCQPNPTLYLGPSSTLNALRNPSQATLASAQLGCFDLPSTGKILDPFYPCPCPSLELPGQLAPCQPPCTVPGPHVPLHPPLLFLLAPVLPSHQPGCLEAESLSLFPTVTVPHTARYRQLNAHQLFAQ